ncbi:hypothetical protein [Pseudoalteromonas peptidolytica]|uniref:hypothetical protein n=1 Tax=Pseudoalteromonas peptidolytica TaxID=61150 RepID=UPI00298E0BCF|nr:hypothetical protein [Pseudoalteromonas peptidolytica]MDW7551436.1 hypothetical protein [Pseudoalteromonas peptidolytica]
MSSIFNGGKEFYSEELFIPAVNLNLLITSMLYTALRFLKKGLTTKATLACFLGLISFLLIVAFAFLVESLTSLSVLLLLFLYTVVSYLLIVEESMADKKEKDFWKFIIEFNTVIVRFILLALIAGIAVLRFFADESNGHNGFIGILIYPTFVGGFTVFQICYWIILPAWDNYSKASSNDDQERWHDWV